ncbi:hypothetical protein D9O29_05775 [Pantoea vagans]|uniref:DSBA-like thioredoxin domain-containing protein n=1 Tax=Pantoea vagans TaxID=470934 RepID=A0ABY3LIF3_9GAMM|nr:hypothetical protein D9O29_05775 [Pantoea vagans]
MLDKFLLLLMLIGSVPAIASTDTQHYPVSTCAQEEASLQLLQSDPLMKTKLLYDPLSPEVGAEEPVLKIISFINYDCIQCRILDGHLERLLRAYPQLAITYKLIAYGPEVSTAVTRMALTVWIEQPEKFHAFHHALMAYGEMAQDSRISSAFSTAGMQRIKYRPDTQRIIDMNKLLMKNLHCSGTPVTIIGNKVFIGEVTYEALEDAVNLAMVHASENTHLAVMTEG